MRVLIAFGTRPEFIKLAPVARELRLRGHEVRALATGQHYDPELADVFFRDLALHVDERWDLGGDEAARVGEILTHAYRELEQRRPDVVVLVGDTHTVPLFCLAARRYQVPVAHLEAGLRSFNGTSIEEVNRRVAASIASLHLAPTELAATFLRREGVADERIRVVGNPIIDALVASGAARRPLSERSLVTVTVHRPTNVDDPGRLRKVVELLGRLQDEIGPVVFPVHPRTAARLAEHDLDDELAATGIDRRAPVPYSEMLELLATSKIVVTDSGGLQEEAAYFGVPAVVLRSTTPRWEGVRNGSTALVGMDIARALAEARTFGEAEEQARISALSCPYGDGRAATRIADLLDDCEVLSLLRIDEPSGEAALPW